MKRPFYICCPPQKQRRDVSIFTDTIEKANRHGYPIHFLGELSYEAVLKNLGNSACLFRLGMPQETFGLVYLEANKLGVPVITHEKDAAEALRLQIISRNDYLNISKKRIGRIII